jgi:hypothetical protein
VCRLELLDGNRNLGHLHKGKSAFLHPGAPRADQNHHREFQLDSFLNAKANLLSFGTPKGPPNEAVLVLNPNDFVSVNELFLGVDRTQLTGLVDGKL